jgi:parallel beta-helix repeat protein
MFINSKLLALSITLLLTLSFTALLAIPIPVAHAITCVGTAETPATVTAASVGGVWTISIGGTYCLAAGTYTDQITIAANGVTLSGATGTTPATVIIRPPTVTDNFYTAAPANFEPAIIYVGAAGTGATITGLTVDGSAAGSTVASNIGHCNDVHGNFGCWFGISYWGASGTITNNVITNINNGGTGGGYATTPGWGNGIHVGIPSGSASVTISGNTVSNYAENGITCRSTGVTCTITGNAVSPLAAAEIGIISNGIEIAFGATGTISGNTVSGNACTATSAQVTLWNDIEYAPFPASNSPCGPSPYQFSSTGILTDHSSGATILGNTLTGNDVGIYLSTDSGTVTATFNLISSSKNQGIYVTSESNPVTISGNAVSGTLCSAWIPAQNTGQPICGSDLINDNQAQGIATYSNTGVVTVSGNTLTNNDVGIYLLSDTVADSATLNVMSGETFVGLSVYDQAASVSNNRFLSEPVGIEAVSDGPTATATASCNTFVGVTTPTTTNGAAAHVTGTSCSASTGATGTTITSFTGTGTFDHTGTTGVKVAISGSPYSPIVNVVTEGLPTPYAGIPASTFTNVKYYDVLILGITTGTANVCVNDALAISATTLLYYNGASWVGATGVVATPFVKVCGNIPVLALNGGNVQAADPPAIPAFPLPFAIPLVLAATALIYLAMRRRIQV